MQKIDLRELWNMDIISSEALNELLEKLMGTPKFLPHVNVKLDKNSPPVFLYQEARGKHNDVSSIEYYGGRGESAINGIASREPLKLSTEYVLTVARGEILDAFCRLEFCVDVLVCISQGVFEGKLTYKKLEQEQFKNPDGCFSSVEKKLVYLHHKAILHGEAYELLDKCRKIRNVLGHQYLPQRNIGVHQKDLDHYGSLKVTVETIFNAAWFYLLKDYNVQQEQIAEWLVARL